jgi:hypothetical protein
MKILLLLPALICLVGAGEIDNKLTGLPIVDCQDTAVSLTFNTDKPFTGRVYVKGLVDDDRCSRNFATNADQSKFSMQINQGDCSMQRQRVSGALEGLMFSLVIVVSFHGTFETKNDRAFRCMCFFRNIKRVTNFLDVSMLGTTELLDTAKMPNCLYTIHSQSPTGPLARYAKVGDLIYHVWECDDENQGILVHSCWVNDGKGQRFDLLDIDGCAVDPVIQPDVKYEPSLQKAFVETWAYKFSDTSVLDYQCVVELCKKAQGECNGLTPPVCGRGKRSVDGQKFIIHASNKTALLGARRQESNRDNELDLLIDMNVLDTLDEELGQSGVPQDLMDKLNSRSAIGHHPRGGLLAAEAFPSDRMCLSTPAFGMMIAITVILFLTSVITSTFMCLRTRNEKH